MVDVVFYRARTSVGRASTFHVIVDGQEAGTLRGSKTLTVPLSPGPHVASARAGRAGSFDVNLDVADGRPTMVVIDVAAKEPGIAADPRSALVLREIDSRNAPASRRSPLRFDDESARTRWLLGIAFALLVVGLILRRFSQVVGIAVGGVAAIVIIVFVVNKLIHRDPRP